MITSLRVVVKFPETVNGVKTDLSLLYRNMFSRALVSGGWFKYVYFRVTWNGGGRIEIFNRPISALLSC